MQSFPAYFVGSTAPNNVEDPIGKVNNPAAEITTIAEFLSKQENPQLLITVHGYNTALGEFSPVRYAATDKATDKTTDKTTVKGHGVKKWYQDIREHIEEHCAQGSDGLVFIGYRWPSEQINGGGNDSLFHKLWNASQSLPSVLKVIAIIAIALFSIISLTAILNGPSQSASFGIVAVIILILATIAISLVFTLFLLRIVGYFRDSYRASNFGVPDLVEFIRQIDNAVMAVEHPKFDKTKDRVKLSFIGHSMGGFVVTDTVRILSDVFDSKSIGNLGVTGQTKAPSPNIGNIFSLGHLVLVSPDIPAETIISGRANFLSSSLRRFQETYLFSNEGDMALKLASTAANYASFPSKTREGGYRLGNVVIKEPNGKRAKGKKAMSNQSIQYGIVNLDAVTHQATQNPPSFLDYLRILSGTSLSSRQQKLIDIKDKPIAELFTVFDCTDYDEPTQNSSGQTSQRVGLLSRALGKRSLSFWDYVALTSDMFTGKIDTHGGYFYSGDSDNAKNKPAARVTKQLIYGLACLGFSPFLASLSTDNQPTEQPQNGLTKLSALCAEHHIQVLLAAERYQQDVLKATSNRNGY